MSAVLTAQRISGMGSRPHEHGVAFRVWAPHADRVSVIGTFNDWSPEADVMEPEDNGHWYINVERAAVGDEYQFAIVNGDQQLKRIDPYAREVTNSVGNAVVHDSAFDWQGDDFQLPPFNQLIIYEMHIGTFHRSDTNQPGTFADAIERLDHLRQLGVNVIQIMPVAEFAGDLSWGYNPAHPFAVESAYGGPNGLKEFVRAAHAAGFGVVMDVVYNHFGPSDLAIWQFDGWSENDKGGIYFYNDYRSSTPWGDTRPDYGRGEVRQFIRDNAQMWLEEYHVDGLRYDMTAYIRTISGIGDDVIEDGWGLMQWINQDLSEQFPGCLLVAEDLQKADLLTKPVGDGGAGFSTQWDAAFVHPVRNVVQQLNDTDRNMWTVHDALQFRYNHDAFQRVIYSESHDEVANGKARVPEEIDSENPDSVYAQRRASLAALLALTAPGIPMLFQGQEFLEDGWFQDTEALNWKTAKRFRGITQLYTDLIRLRRNSDGVTRGLTGQHISVHHVNDIDKVIAFHRFSDGGAGDDVVVLVNFSHRDWEHYEIGFPCPGKWTLRINTDWSGYSTDFTDNPQTDITAAPNARDGYPASAAVACAAYSALVFSQSPHESSQEGH